MTDELVEQLQTMIKEVPYGDISFTIYNHAGETRSMVANKFRNTLFHTNADAVAWVLARFKSIVDDSSSGTMSFTITHSKGEIKKVTEQIYEQKILK